ncbi:PKD domain-containing protein, partial [Sulfurovum sp. TSL6]|uniref:PKD domain-containing protein n=1 Tax=Sulfurovum sp. TSL6 TaxID=2826995 RepID=UPI001CC5E245
TLTVTDDDGATATDSMNVTVTAVPPANIPPIADAGADQNVEVNQSITITGSGTDSDGNITAYEWKKGTTILATTASFSYTPDTVGTDTLTLTVTDDDGATATDSMNVTVTAVPPAYTAYIDDFSTDTTSEYITEDTWTKGGVGSFTYDSSGKRIRILTDNDIALQFSRSLPISTEGSFSIDFSPTIHHPSGGIVTLKLIQDAQTYYEVTNTDNYGPGEIAKYVNGVKVDSVAFGSEYTQGTNYTISINFSPSATTVEAFGDILTLNSDTTAIAVSSFSVEVTQQDAYFDNIVYSIAYTEDNILPIANAGVDKRIEVNQSITIAGNGIDIDGTIATYTWKKGITVLATTASFIYTPDTVGLDTLTLTVTDNEGAIGIDSMTLAVTAIPKLLPWSENPWYWSYKDIPILLLGGSDDDNIFQWREEALLSQLDRLVNAGGNVIRNTMSDRKSIEGFEVYPFHQLEDGKYDLNQWNNEYWNRFERLLRETAVRGIIVQIEIWDRFDYSQSPWEMHPYNPINNINYNAEQSGFAEVYPNHPNTNEQPFFFTTPNQQNNTVVLQYQKRFVDKMLYYSLQYDHVIYCMDNEASGEEEWGRYWAEYVQSRAAEEGRKVFLTEMWDDWDLTADIHKRTFDHPELYAFVEVSQNNHQVGQVHWDHFIYAKEYLSRMPRPMNNTKTYGADGYKSGDDQDGIERFWRHLLAGAASIRFHRPTAGLGLNDKAVADIRAARKFESIIPLWLIEPANELLSRRGENEAYLAVDKDRQSYAIYFPAGGDVYVDVSAVNGSLVARWIDINSGEWGPTQNFEGGDRILVVTPGEGNWAATIMASNEPPSATDPIANAGSDQNVTQGDTVTLDGSGSTDPDGTITSYEWRENGVVLSMTASFEKSNFSVGSHTLILIVTDDAGAMTMDSMTVTVTAVAGTSAYSDDFSTDTTS